MKTEQKGKGFEPITIILETEDEAKVLFTLLAEQTISRGKELLKEHEIVLSKSLGASYDVGYYMYNSFVEVYDPTVKH
jgi:hypothetical protein